MTNKKIRAPKRREKFVLRLMILIGLLSFANFFYWFLNPKLIEDRILFGILIISILYDTLKVLYLWYHYWNISIPNKPQISRDFSVDILTTYFPGEPYEMIKETLLAIQRIKYPHITYLCDEANDQYLKDFCAQNSVIHVTRTNRIDAKAGNINNALLQAKGEICVVIDPDHVPTERFLDEVLPYFTDEKIGYVQTVQAYYNVGESAVARGAAEQTFHFYGPVMMTMNSYGTVNAIGANCVFRREALDSIGGHAAGLSEDMHTAMQLHAKGWKSVYVPKVLTRGLVPASLTAYYKQQLKWSRGTLELLASVYPRLFNKFTWRQKIHYAILPFHYLSGISYLISFIIPIISLFLATTPWKGNFVNFGLIVAPVFVSIIGVRFYIQRWVIHDSERGIHLIGGLLQTCTWWIFNLGLLYTLIRKNVPYLPTPKEDKESTSWKILVPNLLVGIVSVIAVIYGLSIDFTPFSILMSGFALLNACFMFYTIFFAFQNQKKVTLNDLEPFNNTTFSSHVKNFIFLFWRKAALVVTFIVLTTSAFVLQDIEFGKWEGVKPEVRNKHLITYLGIFAPQIDNGITNLNSASHLSKQINEKFDIISLYLAWHKDSDLNFPQSLLDSIYNQKSIPMITWEPWINSFQVEMKEKKHVFELIDEGYFDSYLARFASKLKNLNRPVFLRFAHEFDNPAYPWHFEGEEASVKFKKAWTHTYEIFKNLEANNVIWIWNPWKAENIKSFYPGMEYVDWIGVNILNYGKLNEDAKWHNFNEIYQPFHDELTDLPTTPVIISEFGTLKEDQKQDEWLKKAFVSIENEFDEIKSVIIFNSKVDNNMPYGLELKENLDWTISEKQIVRNGNTGIVVPDYVFSKLPELKSKRTNYPQLQAKVMDNVNGINLKVGHEWQKDYHVFNRKKLVQDFQKFREIGITTIKFEGNSIYDYNILKIAEEFKLRVSFGFWIPADIDFVNDTIKTFLLKQKILDTINKYKDRATISAWNIQNDVQYNQREFFLKPRLLYQNIAYVNWLKGLIIGIKEIDVERPVSVDLEVNLQSINHAKILVDNVKGIDGIGLVVKNDNYLDPLTSFLEQSKIAYLYSEISVPTLIQPEISDSKLPFFVTAWQDQHESNKLTFEGIVDRKGKFKSDYFKLVNYIQKSNVPINSPRVRILKPATPIYDNAVLSYYAVVYDSIGGWKFGSDKKDLNFEWSLVKCDKYGNYLAIKDIGTGNKLSLQIPENHEYFRLLLTSSNNKIITTEITTLNTPLIQKEDNSLSIPDKITN